MNVKELRNAYNMVDEMVKRFCEDAWPGEIEDMEKDSGMTADEAMNKLKWLIDRLDVEYC